MLNTALVEAAQTTSLEPAPATREKPRLQFIDNLRWVMIVLVVSMHAAVTYSHLGSWYFMEDPQPSQAELVVFAAYQMFLQAFFMGLLFLVAGYFVPGAFERKGAGHFLRDRALRLGVPSLLYMLVIHPLTVYWLLRAFMYHSYPTLTKSYLPYVTSGRFLAGSGPMWFALALLLFSFVYAVGRKLNPKLPASEKKAALPTNKQVTGLALAVGLCTFLVRIWQPIGTNILNMQLCFFSQYIMLFIVGVLAWRGDWLMRIPYRFGMTWLTAVLVVGTLAWFGIILAAIGTHTEPRLSGGWTWQSAALSFWESFFCVGVCLGLIVLFREKFHLQGKVARWLSDNCFAVYVFHPPLLIAITLALHGLDAPKLAKFVLATVLGVAVTYVASSVVFRRIPVLRRFL